MTISKVLTGRIREYVANDACDEPSLELLALLKDTFTTAEALDAGRQLMVTERTVMNYLRDLARNRLVHKVRQGVYEKVSYTPWNRQRTETAMCNPCLQLSGCSVFQFRDDAYRQFLQN